MKYLAFLLVVAVGYCRGKVIPYGGSGGSGGGSSGGVSGGGGVPSETPGYGPILLHPSPVPEVFYSARINPNPIYSEQLPLLPGSGRVGGSGGEVSGVSEGNWRSPIYIGVGDGGGGGHISFQSSSGSSFPSPWIPRQEPRLPMPQMPTGGGGQRESGGVGEIGGIGGGMSRIGSMGGGYQSTYTHGYFPTRPTIYYPRVKIYKGYPFPYLYPHHDIIGKGKKYGR